MSAGDDAAGAVPVAVVAHRFWTNQLGADRSFIGRTITINETPVQIVGVAPPEFFGLDPSVAPDFWIPLSLYRAQWARSAAPEEKLDDKYTWWLQVAGRLKPQVTRQQAFAEIDVLFARSIGATAGKSDPSIPSLEEPGFHRGKAIPDAAGVSAVIASCQ